MSRGLSSLTKRGRILRMEGDGDVFSIRAWREDDTDSSDEDEEKEWEGGTLYQ